MKDVEGLRLGAKKRKEEIEEVLVSLIAAFIGCVVIGQPAPDGTWPPPIRALLITGHNNHNWQYTSRVHKDTLEATGRFVVDIADTPGERLAQGGALRRYQLFVLDYNDMGNPKRWGEAAERNFEEAVKNGTGVVAIHSANNAFEGWAEYEKMIGLMWREGTGHGRFHKFGVSITDHDHPITRGLAGFADHPDELYHKLVNSQKVDFHVLATAHSAPEAGGTGNDEPMAITLEYGKGRVFATPLGHVWVNATDTKGSICDPNFKILLCRGAEWAATGAVTLGTQWKDVRPHNVLNEEEKALGWELLFNGTVADKLRGFKQEGFPAKGWEIKDGAIHHVKGAEGGDLVTDADFENFEFVCQWKVSAGGNSGIIYRCDEEHEYSWQTGLELQVLDDAGHADGKNEKTRAGTLYGLIKCATDVARPAGEWNEARIVAKGSKIEHWLNGYKVVECDLDSEAYQKLRAESKFAAMADFGRKRRGHIALQDHGDEVWFRDLKVRKVE